jgi:acyl carrier protein
MNNIINNKDIYEKIQHIFSDRFEMDIEAIGRENFDKHLLGSVFRLAPRDLIYIYLDIERILRISLPDEDVAAGGLGTIDNILELVNCQLQKTKKEAV